mmetsp:Transcript_33497/g.74135  ORF Transcript_33497/g.74135 Transcript_33497/m.74135 type:complete len:285 (+) Transcript_33497:196-1050(+)
MRRGSGPCHGGIVTLRPCMHTCGSAITSTGTAASRCHPRGSSCSTRTSSLSTAAVLSWTTTSTRSSGTQAWPGVRRCGSSWHHTLSCTTTTWALRCPQPAPPPHPGTRRPAPVPPPASQPPPHLPQPPQPQQACATGGPSRPHQTTLWSCPTLPVSCRQGGRSRSHLLLPPPTPQGQRQHARRPPSPQTWQEGFGSTPPRPPCPLACARVSAIAVQMFLARYQVRSRGRNNPLGQASRVRCWRWRQRQRVRAVLELGHQGLAGTGLSGVKLLQELRGAALPLQD